MADRLLELQATQVHTMAVMLTIIVVSGKLIFISRLAPPKRFAHANIAHRG